MLRAAASMRLLMQVAASCNPPTLSRWSSALMAKERLLWLPHNANIGLGKLTPALESHPSIVHCKESRVGILETAVLMVLTGRSHERQQSINTSLKFVRMFGSKAAQDQNCRDLSESSGSRSRAWQDFDKARGYARSLDFDSQKEWREWSKSAERPADIPSSPDQVYKDGGWKSWGDFLGFNEGNVAGEWRSFEEARDYVRSLGLRSKKKWWEWSKSGQRPPDVPSSSDQVYKGKGWLSWADFLGYNKGHVAKKRSTTKRRSFPEARDFVRSFRLKSHIEWTEWSKSGLRPSDIPARPDRFYKGKGWKSWGDFLGFDEGYVEAAEWRSFEEAPEYDVHSLQLRSMDMQFITPAETLLQGT